MKPISVCFVLSIVFFVAPAPAQPEEAPQAQRESGTQTMPTQEDQEAQGMGQMGSMMPMQSMAESMKAMADMCRHMMEREMAMRPYKMAAGALFGLLLMVALTLLIVLQVQWIIHWKRRLSAPHVS